MISKSDDLKVISMVVIVAWQQWQINKPADLITKRGCYSFSTVYTKRILYFIPYGIPIINFTRGIYDNTSNTHIKVQLTI